jgi:LacI family transcriptional regulator
MQQSPQNVNERVTLKDVAARAGVAVTTVSSALHRNGRVSEKLRQTIQALAREMGYEPKMAAQLLRSNTTGHIGLLLPGHIEGDIGESGHAGPILSNFVRACEQRAVPYHVELVNVKGGFEPPRQIVGGLVDGVLVGGYVDERLNAWLEARGCPWVSVDEMANYCVLSANDEGMYQAVQRLAALGHRRLAYVGRPGMHLSHRLALDGFKKAVADFQLDFRSEEDLMIFNETQRPMLLQKAAEWAGEILVRPDRPTAILCHDMVLARGIAYEALRRGVEVPRDLSLVAVGTAVDAEKAMPCLSTIEVNFENIVDQAVSLLVRKLRKEPAMEQPQTRRVAPRLVMRQTVAPPPQ